MCDKHPNLCTNSLDPQLHFRVRKMFVCVLWEAGEIVRVNSELLTRLEKNIPLAGTSGSRN